MSEERLNSVPKTDSAPPPEPHTPLPPPVVPPLSGRGKPRVRSALKATTAPAPLTPPQRLLILDAWRRSGLPAEDFAPLVCQ